MRALVWSQGFVHRIVDRKLTVLTSLFFDADFTVRLGVAYLSMPIYWIVVCSSYLCLFPAIAVLRSKRSYAPTCFGYSEATVQQTVLTPKMVVVR